MKAYNITNACDMANKAAIIPIFTISFPAGLSIKRAATGILHGLIFMFRLRLCQRSLKQNSGMK